MKDKYNLYKWINWSVLSGAFIIVFFHRFSMGVVSEDIAKALGLTGTALANITAVNFYTYALMQIPVGILVDYYGPRETSGGGMLIAALGSFIFAISSNIWMAFLGRLLVGVGVSTIFVAILKIQSVWFKPSEFSTASGLTSLIGNIGSILATTPLALMVIWIGWRMSFMIMGIITLVFVLLIFKFVHNSPENLGFDVNIVSHEKKEMNIWKGMKSVLLNKYTWPNFIILVGFMGPFAAFGTLWGIPYIIEAYGVNKATASSYLAALPLGIMLGSPVIGFASDFFGGKKKRILASGALVFTLVWVIILVFFKGRPPLLLLPILLFILGVTAITHILAFTNVKEVNPSHLSGIAVSIINFGEFLAGSLMTLMTGYLLDLGWSGAMREGTRIYSLQAYVNTFYIFIVCGVIALIGALTMLEKNDKDLKELDK